jgi:N-acylglucosamine 2-epimerase
VYSGYYARCAADWSTIAEGKSICVQLDFMKVAHVLHELTGDCRFVERMAELADLVAFRMREPRNGAVLEFFHRDWRYDPARTRDVLELGHNVKAVRWLLETDALTGDPRHVQAAMGALQFALQHAWDPRFGGFYQHVFRSGRLAGDKKDWWSQCEGLWALLLMHRETGEPRFAELAQELMHFCFTCFADPEHGDWYMTCHADGTPADDRKGCHYKAAYHVVDGCMAPIALRVDDRAAAAAIA